MTLHREILRPEAEPLLQVLSQAEELEGFTLIGGTALALQIGHRRSLDFDFALFGGQLPGFHLDQMIPRLKREGHHAQMITRPEQIAGHKINTGENLLDLVRDYVIDGVKVTFFIHGKNAQQRAFYQQAEKVQPDGWYFNILGIEGLKAAKTLVLADRVRSRDLYDLYTLNKAHGYSLEELFKVVTELGTVDDPEHYKAILRGEIPLDRDDEGLEAVEVIDGYDVMYRHFNQVIDEYEVEVAKKHFLSGYPNP